MKSLFKNDLNQKEIEFKNAFKGKELDSKELSEMFDYLNYKIIEAMSATDCTPNLMFIADKDGLLKFYGGAIKYEDYSTNAHPDHYLQLGVVPNYNYSDYIQDKEEKDEEILLEEYEKMVGENAKDYLKKFTAEIMSYYRTILNS